MTTVTTPEQVSIFEFGRMTGLLESLSREVKQFNERIIFRTDNLESRVEVLEKLTAKGNVWIEIGERAMWGVLGVVCMLAMRGMGVVA